VAFVGALAQDPDMRLGRWEVVSLTDASFALDGGALFGVVPRPRWEGFARPDARHRVGLLARCVLAVDRDGRRVVLVDAGPGEKWGAERVELHALSRPSAGGLDAGLARAGFSRDAVTDVIVTHLHLHHAGGVTRRGPDGQLALSFPRAAHHVQRRHWQHAHAPSEKDAGSFLVEDFELLAHSDQLHLVDGEGELFPDCELVVSEGHTVALQLPRFHGDGTHLTCCGDVFPTRAHLEPSWVSAFDLQPVTSIEEKRVLLAEALEDGGILALGHDLEMPACRLGEREGHPVFREAVEI
jgi:glyoxylase-like metal-dependent hydrolase (beta-lactamase superfamily II)